ncbi:MAG: flavodoxin domain-containing protein [Bacteroidales bacterium]|nr:flavodoxin domain-containing protein [Bacteroidales bacterium]
MKKIGIFYSSGNNTLGKIAQEIGTQLHIPASDIRLISTLTQDSIHKYDMLIFGSSENCDGKLPKEWDETLTWLKKSDLSGITIALFGCGKSKENGALYCNGMGILYDELKKTGASFTGSVTMDDYPTSDSPAVKNDKYTGLIVDEGNGDKVSEKRVNRWICILNNNPDTQDLLSS